MECNKEDYLACMGELPSFDIINHPSKQRCVVARRKFKKGDVVIKNQSFGWKLMKSSWNTKCAACFQPCQTLLCCSKCKIVNYCSRNCQKSDWVQHKAECAHLPYLVNKYKHHDANLTEILLILRTCALEVSTKKNKNTGSCFAGSEVGVCGCDHFHQLSTGVGGRYNDDTTCIIQEAATLTRKTHSVDDIIRLITTFRANNFGVLNDLLQCVGAAIHPLVAMLNHSCVPNCLITYPAW